MRSLKLVRTLLAGAFSLLAAVTVAGPGAGVAGATTLRGAAWVSPNSPQSASGCNSDVCIDVDGTGLYVNYVDSYAYPSNYVRSYAMLWVNNSLYAESGTICISGNAGQSGEAYFGLDRDFANGTVICTTWYNIPGRPCETVEG